jgi:hypothetical protein
VAADYVTLSTLARPSATDFVDEDVVAMGRWLLGGAPLPLGANAERWDYHALICLALCVNGYERHAIEELLDGKQWAWGMTARFERAGSLSGYATQVLLDVLFFLQRADYMGGGYGELVDDPMAHHIANEVRRRVENSGSACPLMFLESLDHVSAGGQVEDGGPGMLAVDNPWSELPVEAPFVAPCDSRQVDQFQILPPPPEHELHLDLLPEPYLGRPDAPVVLLNLNPGFNDADIDAHRELDFAAAARKTLLHQVQDYPFYLLDPRFAGASGARWWHKYLGELVRRYGAGRVANTILCVEYFPYHSNEFGFPEVLPSQAYSFGLVERAIERNAVIIALRKRADWIAAVPRLSSYSKLYELRQSRSVWVTPGNCPDGFPAIVEAFND